MPSNEYFTPTGYPSTNAAGTSSTMRSELGLIEDGFDKLPALTGNANKLIGVNAGGNALESKSAESVKTALGLGNVDNTSDLDKPVSTATQDAIDEAIDGIDLSSAAYNDIIGGDITKTGANQLTISACRCWDSSRAVLLETSVSKTLSIPSSANTIYHIFAVKLVSDSSVEFRAYTTNVAVASDAQVNAYRRIDFWTTNGSSNCSDGYSVDGVHFFLRGSESVLQGLTLSPATITIENKVPPDIVSSILFGGYGSSNAAYIYIKSGSYFTGVVIVSNTTDDASPEMWEYGDGTIHASMLSLHWMPFIPSLTVSATSASGYLCVRGVKLRR